MPLRGVTAAVLALALVAPAQAADPRQDEQWGLEMVQAPGAWRTSTGIGALVAVIDSGVQAGHPDLAGRLAGGFDYVGADPLKAGDEDSDPNDGNGHGTHVTGIVVANAGNGEGIAGVAPGARVLPLRVLDDNGEGYADDTTKAVRRAIDAGADVINLSLGDALPLQSALVGDPAFEAALKRALDAGIVVALAGGNNGLPLCENPNLEGVICVGSVDSRRTRSAFSSFGPDIDVMAPGGSGAGTSDEDVLSTWLSSDYEAVAGTSQATPHVAGVAALLVSLGVRGFEARARILSTASDAGQPGRDVQYGNGIVDAAAAVAGLAPPDDPKARGSFSTRRKVRERSVRRRGFRVKCRAVRPGTCRVKVVRGGKRIGGGRAAVPAADPTRVVARLNKRGKRSFKRAKRRFRVTLRVTLPGERPRKRRVTVRP